MRHVGFSNHRLPDSESRSLMSPRLLPLLPLAERHGIPQWPLRMPVSSHFRLAGRSAADRAGAPSATHTLQCCASLCRRHSFLPRAAPQHQP
eukprot:gene8263-biopygen3053